MKFLWAFLLLAFTIDSVYSQACISPKKQQEQLEKGLNQACGGINGLNLPTLTLGSPLTVVLGAIISSVTNLMLVNPKVVNVNVKVTETGLTVEANFTLGMSCPQFGETIPTLNISIKVNLKVDVDKNNGCPVYTLDEKSITITLSINGKTTTVISTLLNVLLSLLTSTFNSLFKGVVAVAVNLINEASKEKLRTFFLLGNAMCRYTVYGIQYSKGNHNFLFSITYNGGNIQSPGPPTSTPAAPQTGYFMMFSASMVSAAVNLTLNGSSVQITLAVSQVIAGLPGTDTNANISVVIKFMTVKDCKLQEGSGSVTVSVNVSLKESDKVIASVTADVTLNLRVEYKGGSMSLNVNVNAGAGIIFSGGGGSAAGEFLKKVCGLYLGVWVDKVNCQMGMMLPVVPILGSSHPAPTPTTPTSPPTSPMSPPGQCVFRAGFCECSVPK